VVALPVVLAYIPLPGVTAFLVQASRWALLFLLITLALAVLYRYGPSRTEPQWRWVTWGSVSAAIVWLAASALFSWYAASFGSYNKTYGSLGAIIGFMTWIWLSIIVVLVGAQPNAEIEHQTGRDSTPASRSRSEGAGLLPPAQMLLRGLSVAWRSSVATNRIEHSRPLEQLRRNLTEEE
jgi:membrane protein